MVRRKIIEPALRLFRYTWRHSRGTRHYFVTFLALSVVANVFILMEPLVIARLFNSIQFQADDPGLLEAVLVNLAILLALRAGFLIFHHSSRILEVRNAFLAAKNYKTDMLTKVLDLPMWWHKQHHSGATIEKINRARTSLHGFSGSLFTIVENIVRLVGSIIILFAFDWMAATIILIVSIFTFWAIVWFDERLRRQYLALFEYETRLASAVHDYISNIITVVTLRLKPKVINEVDTRAMNAYPQVKRITNLNEAKWAFLVFITTFAIIATLAVNAYVSYTTTGIIVIGTLFALYGYLQNVAGGFSAFASRYGDIIRQDASMKAAARIEREYDRMHDRSPDVVLPLGWQRIEIKRLSFSYFRKTRFGIEERHLHDVGLTIHRGEKIALIGESGSGKSTTMALLRGLHEPERATLIVDGKRMRHGLKHLRQHVTLIPQEPELFNSTVRDNITMGRKTTQQELMDAIEMARFTPVLHRLKRGLNTNVKEKGVNLSGGEKQRLALARGLLAARDTEILFLDEPTSSVDPGNERQIYETIMRRFRQKTIVSTLHKLYLLPQFDRIYWFEKGRIIAHGSFKELLKNPRFKELWERYSQSQKNA